MLKYIPNILTLSRLVFIPFIVHYIFSDNYIYAFILFTISGITDVVDGFLARKYNLISNFGKLMDPLADKLTQISVIASLVILNIIPEWVLIIVFIKEFFMIIGASFLYGKDVVVYSRWYGKLATILFYIAIVVSLITSQYIFNNIVDNIDLILYILASLTTIFAFIMYFRDLYKKGILDSYDLKKDVKIEEQDTLTKKFKNRKSK